MDWYIVIKTINGHRYRYRQKTWRDGERVRTRSEYIGPADGTPTLAGATNSGGGDSRATHFDPENTSRALHALTHTDVRDKTWEHGWSAKRAGPTRVRKIGRVTRLLRVLDVRMTSETRGAFYSPYYDRVNIPPTHCFEDKNGQVATQAYYAMLFHELVHWTCRSGRSKRDIREYAEEELVAELGAMMLMDHFKIDVGNMGRHAKYFQTWLDRIYDRDQALAFAKREAERAVKFLIRHDMVGQ